MGKSRIEQRDDVWIQIIDDVAIEDETRFRMALWPQEETSEEHKNGISEKERELMQSIADELFDLWAGREILTNLFLA